MMGSRSAVDVDDVAALLCRNHSHSSTDRCVDWSPGPSADIDSVVVSAVPVTLATGVATVPDVRVRMIGA